MKTIPLTQGLSAIVDDSDFEVLSLHRWRAMRWGEIWYAVRSLPREGAKRRLLLMHREILGTPTGFLTDHFNGNGLDNRRENLRVATHSQNQANRRRLQSNNKSGIKGVHFVSGIWRAQIKVNGKRIHLGDFKDIQKASNAYARAASEYFGEFHALVVKPS